MILRPSYTIRNSYCLKSFKYHNIFIVQGRDWFWQNCHGFIICWLFLCRSRQFSSEPCGKSDFLGYYLNFYTETNVSDVMVSESVASGLMPLQVSTEQSSMKNSDVWEVYGILNKKIV